MFFFGCFNIPRCYASKILSIRPGEADAAESTSTVKSAAFLREAQVDYWAWLTFGMHVAYPAVRSILKAAVQVGARCTVPRGAKSTKWAWVFRHCAAATCGRLSRPRTESSFFIRAAILEATMQCGNPAHNQIHAVLRSPASPALRLQLTAQIGQPCSERCSRSWPFR